jgi:hypothetical protein
MSSKSKKLAVQKASFSRRAKWLIDHSKKELIKLKGHCDPTLNDQELACCLELCSLRHFEFLNEDVVLFIDRSVGLLNQYFCSKWHISKCELRI